VSILLAAILGYLIGGFPTGILIGRAVKGVDPREIGSRSSGATNVSRLLGRKWAIIVLATDILKGYLPTEFLAPAIARPENVALVSSVMAVSLVVGHVWTPYARFHGGKGVATSAGAMLALSPYGIVSALAVWLCAFLAFRFVSLASMIGAISFPVLVLAWGGAAQPTVAAGFSLALIIIFAHRSNMRRIIRREESRAF